jgi:hypothetical protein
MCGSLSMASLSTTEIYILFVADPQ